MEAAIIDISNANDSTLHYHKAFENTDVLTINPNWFLWRLANPLPALNDIINNLNQNSGYPKSAAAVVYSVSIIILRLLLAFASQ